MHKFNTEHLQEIINILDDLADTNVINNWALCGGIAEQYYTNPPATKDIDFFVTSDDKTIMAGVRIANAFIANGAEYHKHMLNYKGIIVDIIIKDDDLHKKAVEKADIAIISGVELYVLTPDYLAAIAVQTGRDKDIARADELFKAGLLTTIFNKICLSTDISAKNLNKFNNYERHSNESN